jgi:hypothetical protein
MRSGNALGGPESGVMADQMRAVTLERFDASILALEANDIQRLCSIRSARETAGIQHLRGSASTSSSFRSADDKAASKGAVKRLKKIEAQGDEGNWTNLSNEANPADGSSSGSVRAFLLAIRPGAADLDRFSPRALFREGRKTRCRESDRGTKAVRPQANSFRRHR